MSAPRAIVIGAGLSGLAVAYELMKRQYDVLVLEASDRVGGRVFTVRDDFAPLHAEAGAEGVNIKHGFVKHYTDEFGLELAPVRILGGRSQTMSIFTAPWSVRMHLCGRTYSIPQLMINPFRIPYRLKLRERLSFPLALTDVYTRRFERRLKDISNPLQPDLLYLDEMSFWDFLEDQGASPDAIALIEQYHLFASLKELSALYMVWEQARRDFDGAFFRIRGGNDQLPRAFATRIGDRIKLDSAVSRIDHDGGAVTVTYTSDGVERQASASLAICTISLPAMKNVTFNPQLSAAKQTAVRDISYTSLLKTQLLFADRFWDSNGWSGVGYSDRLMQYLLHVTTDQTGAGGILTSFATGAHALELAAQGQAAISSVCDMVAEMDPAARAKFVRGHVKNWDIDPWIGGTHPQFNVGQMTALWPELGRAEGRLYFAGEHTSYWTGWMNGALESGDRVMREIATADH